MLGKDVPIDLIEANKILNIEQREEELTRLAIFVLGAAMMSPQRQFFVQKVLSLSLEDQSSLKRALEGLFPPTLCPEPTTTAVSSPSKKENVSTPPRMPSSPSSSLNMQDKDFIQSLQQQMKGLHQELRHKEDLIQTLEGVVEELKNSLRQQERERRLIEEESSLREEQASSKLQYALLEERERYRQLDEAFSLKEGEREELEAKFQKERQQWTSRIRQLEERLAESNPSIPAEKGWIDR